MLVSGRNIYGILCHKVGVDIDADIRAILECSLAAHSEAYPETDINTESVLQMPKLILPILKDWSFEYSHRKH